MPSLTITNTQIGVKSRSELPSAVQDKFSSSGVISGKTKFDATGVGSVVVDGVEYLLNDQIFTSSGTFNVPSGVSELIIELWGGGGAGGSAYFGSENAPSTNQTAGGASSISSLSLSAGGGGKGNSNSTSAGSGGTASGGDVNTNGSAGTGGSTSGCTNSNYKKGGSGGASGNGGSTVEAQCNPFNGINGDQSSYGYAEMYGNGGSGATGVNYGRGGAGGGGGAYVKKTLTSGIASSYTFTVGAGGAKGTGSVINGGSGGSGAVKFTWS